MCSNLVLWTIIFTSNSRSERDACTSFLYCGRAKGHLGAQNLERSLGGLRRLSPKSRQKRSLSRIRRTTSRFLAEQGLPCDCANSSARKRRGHHNEQDLGTNCLTRSLATAYAILPPTSGSMTFEARRARLARPSAALTSTRSAPPRRQALTLSAVHLESPCGVLGREEGR